jgi:lipopolysaccharide transport system ATP-binding protein
MGSIAVNNLGKAYKQYPSRWARVAEWLVPGAPPRHRLHWVLKEINFVVNPGEAVGIIGMNGAGKSTLLKMIAGTTQPTTGSVHVGGRLAALLELGMGFHPEFTGRQNAFMAGQLMGFTPEEISALMPDIEAFAEIGEYIDQPVRVYSSGMQVRLAFSVATAKRPEILIVDEALSVGDSYFQHKSFDRIKQFGEEGTTLLFVSHSPSAIKAICHRAILLNRGELAMEGEPEAVLDFYNAMLADHQNQMVRQDKLSSGRVRTVSGTGEAKICALKILDVAGHPIEFVRVGQPLRIEVEAESYADLPSLVLGLGIRDHLGQMVFGTNTFHTRQQLQNIKAGERFNFTVRFDANLGPGSYSIVCALVQTDNHIERNFQWIDGAAIINVINADKPFFIGVSWNPVSFEISRLQVGPGSASLAKKEP